MAGDTLTERLWRAIEPVAAELGLELVDVEFRRSGSRAALRVFVDRPGRVTLQECERLSRRLDPLLDAEEVIQGAFDLQVSSPGLDRPLRRPADFARAVGERVRLTLRPLEGRQRVCTGRLRSAGEALELELDDGQIVRLSPEEVELGRIEVSF
jgi:ribosome maturation factor RimP